MEKLNLRALRKRAKAGKTARKARERAERLAEEHRLDRDGLTAAKPHFDRLKKAMFELADEGAEGIVLHSERESAIYAEYSGSNHRRLSGIARGLAMWAKKQGLKVHINITEAPRRNMHVCVSAYW